MSLFSSWVAHDCFHFLCTSFLCLSSAKSSSLTHAGLLPCLLDFLNIAIAGFAFWGGCLWTSTSCPVSPRLSRAVFHQAWQGDPWVSQKSAFLKSKLVTLLLLSYRIFNSPVSWLLPGRMLFPLYLWPALPCFWGSRTSPLFSWWFICLKKLSPDCTQAYYPSNRFWGSWSLPWIQQPVPATHIRT